MFLPGGCGGFMYPSVGMGWRHSGQWGDPASRERQPDKHLLIPSVWRSVPAASDSLCHLLSSKHSNWAKPGAVCGINRHFFQVIFQISPRCVGVVRWGRLQGGLHWLGSSGAQWIQCTGICIAPVYSALAIQGIIPHFATRITDWQTVQTEVNWSTVCVNCW